MIVKDEVGSTPPSALVQDQPPCDQTVNFFNIRHVLASHLAPGVAFTFAGLRVASTDLAENNKQPCDTSEPH